MTNGFGKHGRLGSWSKYAAVAVTLTGLAVLAGWWALDEAGQRGLVLGAGTALLVQLAAFGLLVMQARGTPAFLGAWAAGSFLRLLAVGGVFLVLLLQKAFDPLVTLLVMVGLLFVLLLLESWWIRETANGPTNARERR